MAAFKRQLNLHPKTVKRLANQRDRSRPAICIEKLKKLAKSAGVDVNKARDLIAEYLPVAIDKATPEGKLPPQDKA